MGDFVDRYRGKRQKRLEERFGVDVDTVGEFKKRRKKRLEDRGFRLDYGANDLEEPAAWITVRGNHIPVDEEGNPIGGQKKAVGEGNGKNKHNAGENSEKPKKGPYRSVSPEGYVNGWKPPHVNGMNEKTVKAFLRSCRKIGNNHYEKATDVAKEKRNPHLWTYTSHGIDHVQQVIDKTMEAADAMEKLPPNTLLGGAAIDRPTLLVASWFHDVGMDGDDVDWSKVKKENGEPDDGEMLRKAHGANSAIHVLEHANEIRKMGVDPNEVALIVFSHTKSNSGINDLGNPADWEVGMENLENAVAEHNKETGANVKFDKSKIFDDDMDIRDMAAMVAAIRLGDANREAEGTPLLSQSGGEYKIEKMPEGYFGDAKEEANNAVISITEDGVRHELSFEDEKMRNNPGHPISKRIVLGERNLKKMSAAYNENHRTLQEEVVLEDGKAVPYCTIDALLERCGELNTINGVARAIKIKMTGIKSWEECPAEVKRAYRDIMWTKILTDTKNGVPKYAGVQNLVLEFENGEKRASAHGWEIPKNNKNNGGSGK